MATDAPKARLREPEHPPCAFTGSLTLRIGANCPDLAGIVLVPAEFVLIN